MAFLGPVDFPNMVQTIFGFITGTKGLITGIMSQITGIFNKLNLITSKLKLFSFFALVVALGKCFVSFFKLIFNGLGWILSKLIPWLFVTPWPTNVFETGRKYDKFVEAAFLPWVIRFFIVLSTRVANFPKCFVWYIIDIVSWTLYLPFRFIFWLIDYGLNVGLVRGEHKVWNVLNDIDYYIHGPVRNYFLDQYVTMYIGDKMFKDGQIVPNPKGNQKRKNGLTGADVPVMSFEKFTYKDTKNKNKIIDVEKEEDINKKNEDKSITNDSSSMNLGFHIIHFPNAIMETCYSATNFKLADLPPFPMKDFYAFTKCLSIPFNMY
jgi:hypothetical protein